MAQGMLTTPPPKTFPLFILPIMFLYWMVSPLGTLTAQGQEILTPKQPIATLVNAQAIFLQTQVFQGGIQVDTDPVTEIIARQFRQVGYEVVTNINTPHDVTVYFQCEEPPPDQSLSHSANNAHPPMTGPPCFFQYAFNEIPVDWQRIDIIIYSEGIQAAESLQSQASNALGATALPLSTQYLNALDFSILLSAEWGQVQRMVGLLENSETPLPRRKKIISLLGEIRAKEALPCLLELLNNSALQIDAARALGNFGAKAQKPLISILKSHPDMNMQAAAAQSLGRIGAATGDTSLTPLYLELLRKPGLNIQVKTEIVWAIGKSPDFGAHAALEALESQIWQTRSNEPKLQKLREAVDWSIREVRQGGHTGAYY